MTPEAIPTRAITSGTIIGKDIAPANGVMATKLRISRLEGFDLF